MIDGTPELQPLAGIRTTMASGCHPLLGQGRR
jgi:hypothetical protein